MWSLPLLAALGLATALKTRVPPTPRIVAPQGSLVVCPWACQFSTIQDAINSFQAGDMADHTVYILAGTYKEKVIIPATKGKVTLLGFTHNTQDQDANMVAIVGSQPVDGDVTDEHNATLINYSANTAVYNIDIRNTHGPDAPAIALAALNDKQGYYGIRLFGSSNVLLAQLGNHVYAGSSIQGAHDIIYGQHARAFITRSAIMLNAGGGAITASARAGPSDPGFIVLNHCNVRRANDYAAVQPRSVYLGRPAAPYARVAVQVTELADVVAPLGWEPWNATTSNVQHAEFYEVDNTGPGTNMERAFAQVLAKPEAMEDILGFDYGSWADHDYLGVA